MKTLLLVILAISISSVTFAQSETENYLLNFEDPVTLSFLTIDTVSNPGNIWEVGAPQKNIFVAAESLPNAIVTDLNNPYPVNDTSSFIVTAVMMGQIVHEYMGIQGYYWVNSDTLADYGKIEVSFNHGIDWIDITHDSIYMFNPVVYWNDGQGPSSFTGNSGSWQFFDVNIAGLFAYHDAHPGDTTLYRFTFISDGSQTNKDGLMFDDLYPYNGTTLGIHSLVDDHSKVYPNPANDFITIHWINSHGNSYKISILDLSGKEMMNDWRRSGEQTTRADVRNDDGPPALT